jgi:enoyl-CoA hydratase/carnithine racemase
MSDVILLEKDAGIATITMNRPKAMNAINQELADRLLETLSAIELDPDARVVVMYGGATYLGSPASSTRLEFSQHGIVY